MDLREQLHDTHNKGIDACIAIARYQAQLVATSMATIGLQGTTPESLKYVLQAEAEVKTLNDICASFERLKI
jgi:hypothetical protein